MHCANVDNIRVGVFVAYWPGVQLSMSQAVMLWWFHYTWKVRPARDCLFGARICGAALYSCWMLLEDFFKYIRCKCILEH